MSRPSRIVACLLAVTAAGCSGSGDSNRSTATTASVTGTGTGTEASSQSSIAPADDAPAIGYGAVVALRIARDILPSGAAQGVGVDIEPTAPKVVAVVDAGGWEGSGPETLEFHWSGTDAAGNEAPLFDQRVEVRPGQRAFATALSPGRLALGTYRVKIVLADVTRSIDFFVALPAAEEAPTAAEAAATVVPTTHPFVASSRPRGTEAGPGVAVGEPPTEGPVGTVPGDTGAATAAPAAGCTLTVTPSSEGGSGIWAQASGCAGDTLVLAVTAGGNEKDVPLPGFGGEADLPYDVNPCSFGLAASSAISVSYTIKVVAGPDKGKTSAPYSGTTQPNTHNAPPGGGFSGTPSPGAFVVPGDSILLRVEASDDVHVSRVTVTVDPGNPDSKLVDTTFPVSAGCTHQFDYRTVALPNYVVPADPPEFVTFTATVSDDQGKSQTVVAQYPTRGIWYGDLLGTIKSTGPNFSCDGSFYGLIRVVVDSAVSSAGPVAVSGDALVHGRVGGCQFPANFPATGDVTFTVAGTFDGKVFQLQLAPSGIENQAAWAVALHLFVIPDPPLTLTPSRISNDSIEADAKFNRVNSDSTELSGGGATSALDGRVSLSCCSPNAEPIQPAKRPPQFLGADD